MPGNVHLHQDKQRAVCRLLRPLGCASLLLLSSTAVLAHETHTKRESHEDWRPALYVGASAGYGHLDSTSNASGDSTAGRLVFGFDMRPARARLAWGAEVGVQSGNEVELGLDTMELPIQATLKPFFDILLTVKTVTESHKQPWGVFAKVGAAYRQLQLNDRTSPENSHLNEFAPEVQVGVNYQVSHRATLSLYYQGIYASDEAVKQIDEYNYSLSHIPTQQGGFLGLEYRL